MTKEGDNFCPRPWWEDVPWALCRRFSGVVGPRDPLRTTQHMLAACGMGNPAMATNASLDKLWGPPRQPQPLGGDEEEEEDDEEGVEEAEEEEEAEENEEKVEKRTRSLGRHGRDDGTR